MAIEHTLTSTDTLQSLAQFYLQDSNRWLELVEFNELSFPYFVESEDEKKAITHGNGFILLKRAHFRTAVTIRKGWGLFAQASAIGGQVKAFETTNDTVIPAGVAEAYIHVRSILRGSYGNIPDKTIFNPSRGFIESGISLEFCHAVHTFSGGQDINLLAIGEALYIPSEDTETPYTNRDRLIAYIGGEDLVMTENGEVIVDGFGDFATYTGADNIMQAVIHRLMTERGSLRLHPSYGSNINALIGQPNTLYRVKLIELDIHETLMHEDRISRLAVHSIDVVGTKVNVHMSFMLREINKEITRRITLDYYQFAS